MKYITNGTLLDETHTGQIAYSNDGITWNYYSKEKIKNVSGYNKLVKLWFDDDTNVIVELAVMLNQPTWQLSDGLNTALNDISDWINEIVISQPTLEAIQSLLNDIYTKVNGLGATDLSTLQDTLDEIYTKVNGMTSTDLTTVQGTLNNIYTKVNGQNNADLSGLQTSLNTITTGINNVISSQPSLAATQTLLTDIKKYLNASNGFTVISSASGLVNGNWYLVKTIDDSVFTTLTDNAANLAALTMMSGVVIPLGAGLTTADLSGNGFTSIQISSGKVIAYKK